MIWRCDLVPQYLQYREKMHEVMDRVLNSGIYILGKEVAAFEQEFAQYIGMEFGVGVANATDALTLSLMALGIGSGDEVITTPFTAIPTVSAIIDSGATPVFVDIDPETWLMDLSKLKAAITSRTKAVMPVHIFGNVANIRELREIVGGSIRIVEDASQAHGASIGNEKAGSWGDVSIFSFYPTKNLGAYGDGGIVLTNDRALAEKLKRMRMYGMVDKDHIDVCGINSRLDELQAAWLRIKLPDLDGMNARRREIAARYEAELPAQHFKFQGIKKSVTSCHHVFTARFLGDRAGLLAHLEGAKVQANIYYKVPLHLQEANRFLGWKPGSMPITEKLCEQSVALPLYPELSHEDQGEVIRQVKSYLGN